jgi:hypothetical protein
MLDPVAQVLLKIDKISNRNLLFLCAFNACKYHKHVKQSMTV